MANDELMRRLHDFVRRVAEAEDAPVVTQLTYHKETQQWQSTLIVYPFSQEAKAILDEMNEQDGHS